MQRSAFEVLQHRLEVVEPGDFLVDLAGSASLAIAASISATVLAKAALSRSSTEVATSASTVRPFAETSAMPPSTTIFSCLPAENTVMMPGTNAGDHRRMTGEHAEVTLGARNVDLIDLTGKQQLLGRYEIELEGGHRCLLPVSSS